MTVAPDREDQVVLPPTPSNEAYEDDPQLWDLIVVGCGIAGSALAYAQAKAGRRVLVLERDLQQPDRIVGELLQPGGYLMLKKLGMEDCVTDIDSQKVYGYALIKNGQCVKLGYPMEGYTDDVAGRSFHHGRFVQKLRHLAATQPSLTMRQGLAKRIVQHPNSVGVVIRGASWFPCGSWKVIRKMIQHPSYFVGVIIKGAKLPHPNHGHVVLAKPSPILFYPISSDEIRCLVDVPGSKLPPNLKEYLRTVVSPEVPEQLRDAFLSAIDTGHIRTMQNKQLPAKPLHQPGALLLGDAFNMRHPLTGGGMTVALSDCKLLTDMLQPLPRLLTDMLQPLPSFEDALATSSATADFYTQRKPMSATINTLANALYKVALYGVGRLLKPRPTLKGLWLGVLLLVSASRIIFPIIWAEGIRAVFLPWLAPKPSPAVAANLPQSMQKQPPAKRAHQDQRPALAVAAESSSTHS
ncbi:SE-domain-containing protein [Dunaliella salina]|uniref:Squalene monooxygenase n=1 Tax=Dunaliella salina TaxID=3046 RepID=A0ABQ7GL13_DUNSA|nr:SE-domain-containing protein [Dunaliella salina]|eukprot:KAF5835297.1 SE-domain-containing protein [Dunaliella salina]